MQIFIGFNWSSEIKFMRVNSSKARKFSKMLLEQPSESCKSTIWIQHFSQALQYWPSAIGGNSNLIKLIKLISLINYN